MRAEIYKLNLLFTGPLHTSWIFEFRNNKKLPGCGQPSSVGEL